MGGGGLVSNWILTSPQPQLPQDEGKLYKYETAGDQVVERGDG